MKTKPLQPEDRVITSLSIIRYHLVNLLAEVDKQMDYLEKCKKGAKKCKT